MKNLIQTTHHEVCRNFSWLICPLFSTENLCNEKPQSGERFAPSEAPSAQSSPPQAAPLSSRLPSNMPRNALDGSGVDIAQGCRLLSTARPCYEYGTAVGIARRALGCPENTGSSVISAQGADTQNIGQTCAKLAHLRARETLAPNFSSTRAFVEGFCQGK